MITYKQLTLAEIFEDCQNKFDNDKYQFLSLLDEAIDLDEIIPVSFISHCYASTGRPRKHQLYPMLKALLIQIKTTIEACKGFGSSYDKAKSFIIEKYQLSTAEAEIKMQEYWNN